MVINAEVLKTYDFSLGFNNTLEVTVDRKQYITQIEECLDNNQIIFLAGEEGCGKTVICQEFVKKK
ncbi:DEAD/DEAH box helicase family protein [Paenimyroides baculatum]|uniref:Uncharacterized protein n=1 Tax=Paenimyroides baculatum TaxID=2608000 RepID=A0A5M6CE47_9FLAO|nr:hypothetical protein [Paenimyroides baculatum]KAA5531725.1 hypothetical protein F0460_15140 [Paenimyroides baculatum]